MGGGGAMISADDSVIGMLREIELHKNSDHAEVLRRFDGGMIDW